MADTFPNPIDFNGDPSVPSDQFRAEAVAASELIARYQQSQGCALLALACGAGGHLPALCERFHVVGLDVSPELLASARKKAPGVRFIQGDLVDFEIPSTFDAALNLTGSIGFVLTRENLFKVFKNIAQHLVPGGVLVLSPWFTQESFKEKIVADLIRQPGVRVARMDSLRRTAPDRAVIEMHHLIGEDGQVRYMTRIVEMGLFSEKDYREAIRMAGLELMETYVGQKIAMGAYVARKKG